MLAFVVAVLGLLQAVNASAQPRWGRARAPQSGACFYEDRNFRGRSFCVGVGEELRSLPGGMGDEISSIRLFGGAEVTVFKDRDMRGRATRYVSNAIDLRRDGLNDAISSIVVLPRGRAYGYGTPGPARGRDRVDDDPYGGWRGDRPPVWGRAAVPRAGACFYEDANFRGQYFCVPRGGAYTSLPRGFNDRISSIRVFGAAVRIYEDRNFRGHARDIRRDTGNLRGDWRDTISSIRVF
jgi:hypothetical protein